MTECKVLSVQSGPSLQAATKTPSDEPNLNKDQIKQFLLNAKVVGHRHTSKGITSPWRLTLTDGTLTHDARFLTMTNTRPR